MKVYPHSLAILGHLCVLLVGWGEVAVSETHRRSPPAPGVSGKVDSLLHQAVENGQLAGAVALVAQNGRVLYLSSVRSEGMQAGAFSADSIFRITSMTKPITAAAVMILQERGRLALSDPVSRYLPEWANVRVVKTGDQTGESSATETVPVQRPVTVMDLLTHESGLPGFDGSPAAAAADAITARVHSTRELCQELSKVPLQFQPGTKYLYGVSYEILGCIIESVSGKALDDFFEVNIFTPLAMKDTSFYVASGNRGRLSAIYGSEDGHPLTKRPPGDESEPNYLSAGGGLRTTAADFFRFCQMLANAGTLDGKRVLRAESVAMMTNNHVGHLYPSADKNEGWGLGVELRNRDRIGSVYGWSGFHGNAFFVFPKQKVIGILMKQQLPSGESDLFEQFESAISDAIGP
jgi:CubicO group peptidase (beta-lactamase class C family)